MDNGEFLTRATIWITIVAYTAGSVLFARSQGRTCWDSAVRVAWTIAVVSLIAHLICAYQFFHDWSQTSALRETARKTEEVIGLNWAGGLYINYAFLIVWIVDVGWWWIGGLTSYRARPWPLIAVWHGFIIFILFNATVVFKNGPVRWIGVAVCLVLLLAWARIARQGLAPVLKPSKA